MSGCERPKRRSRGSSLFIDDPRVSFASQLEHLPARIIGAPRVSVVLRSTDSSSRFDRKNNRWLVKGKRHQLLERTFREDDAQLAHFPFTLTTRVIDICPELQLQVVR